MLLSLERNGGSRPALRAGTSSRILNILTPIAAQNAWPSSTGDPMWPKLSCLSTLQWQVSTFQVPLHWAKPKVHPRALKSLMDYKF